MLGDFGVLNTAVLATYLGAMVLIGLAVAGRQRSTEEFFLAGRTMPWWAVGMSMFASLTSATTYMGVPAFAYGTNVAMLFGVAMSPLAAPLLVRWFYPHYRRLGVTTSYAYIRQRYGPTARLVVSGLFVLNRLGWLGIVIYAPARAMAVASGMPLGVAIALVGVLAVTYTVLGGLRAVIWTDVAQFLILGGGALWLAVSLARQVPDGVPGILGAAAAAGRFRVFAWGDLSRLTALSAMVSWFCVFLHDYGTDQVTVQRLLAVRSNRGVAWAIGFNAINDVLINGLLIFIGLGILALHQTQPALRDPQVTGDGILPYTIMQVLPPGAAGLLITAIFAAAMSSVDSGINSLSTVLIVDFVRPLRRGRGATEGQDLRLARVLTVILGGAATLAAVYAAWVGDIVRTWMRVMGLFAAPVLSIFVLGVLTRRARFGGWLVGAFAGIGLTVLLQVRWADRLDAAWHVPLSFAVTTAVGYGASRLLGLWVQERRDPPGINGGSL